MKERLPDPTDLIRTLDYLEYQASQGRFATHPSAFGILIYLARHSWRRVPNAEDAPIGMVMSGKTRLRSIAGGTARSEKTVRLAVRWLEDEDWITVYQGHAGNGRFAAHDIITRLDQRSHENREHIWALRADLEAPEVRMTAGKWSG